MIITTNYHRNFDFICFLHVLTDDELSIGDHKTDFDRFLPLFSDKIKEKVQRMKQKYDNESVLFWPLVNLLLSAVDNHETRDLRDLLTSHGEIREGIGRSPYFKTDTDKKLTAHFDAFAEVIAPFLDELDTIGFTDYWETEKKPLLKARCAVLNSYLEKFYISDEVNRLIPVKDEDILMWVCAYAGPYGAKLCGYNMISDPSWTDEQILSTITHEMFHPPYNHAKVADAVEKLGNLPWVAAAYENQHPNHAYKPMSGFVEENVVEALGIYILTKMITDFDAFGYFAEHDHGSHVISPFLFNYLHTNPKSAEQSFEDYFINFVAEIVKMGSDCCE